MKTLFTILLSGLAVHVLFSQHLCKGVLRSMSDRNPVEFANVGLVGEGIGTVSNAKGEFSFTVPDSLSGGQIMVSMIGYQPVYLTIKDFRTEASIYLESSITALNEVQVTAKKTKITVLGNDTKTKRVQAGFLKNILGSELAIKLNIKHKDTQLRKFFINITRNSIGAPIFRFNVYSVDEKGWPKENLLKQNIIIAPSEQTGLVQVDLLPYNIMVSDDVFISIEWIKDLGDVSGLSFSTKLIGSDTYYRQASQGKWEKRNSIGVGLHAEVAY
jgi:hypothetical protein